MLSHHEVKKWARRQIAVLDFTLDAEAMGISLALRKVCHLRETLEEWSVSKYNSSRTGDVKVGRQVTPRGLVARPGR